MSTRSLNKAMLIGNLTRDPAMRYTPNNTAVCSFSIATNRTWTPADGGEKQERVDYHNIVAWSKLAEVCGQLLHKGDKVYVEGRLQTRKWTGTKDSVERSTTEIVADTMILLTGKGGMQGSSFTNDATEDVSMGGDGMPSAAPSKKSIKPKKASKPAADEEEMPNDEVDDVEDISDDIPF